MSNFEIILLGVLIVALLVIGFLFREWMAAVNRNMQSIDNHFEREKAWREREVELRGELREANERLIYQLTMMKREGFATIPEDEPFETYRLTPEMEADIEETRNREG